MAINFDNDILTLYATNVANETAYQTPGDYNIPEGYATGEVTGVTVDTDDGGHTSTPTISFSGSGGASALPHLSANTVTVASGGTGYTVGDTLTVQGGTSETVATLNVTSVNAGAVDGIEVQIVGDYTDVPNSPVSVTGGTGNDDATFNLTWDLNSIEVTDGGTYDEAPDVTVGGGSGGTATATATIDGVDENRILTTIEVLRSLLETIDSTQEAKLIQNVLLRVSNNIHVGRPTTGPYPASEVADRAQEAAVRMFATHRRDDSF